jgi:hypothetical protein
MTKVYSVNKAIQKARKRVAVIHYGRDDFVVQHIDEDNNTRASHHMDRLSSQAYAKEKRIDIALEYLDMDERGAVANGLVEEEGRWDVLVRSYVRKQHNL